MKQNFSLFAKESTENTTGKETQRNESKRELTIVRPQSHYISRKDAYKNRRKTDISNLEQASSSDMKPGLMVDTSRATQKSFVSSSLLDLQSPLPINSPQTGVPFVRRAVKFLSSHSATIQNSQALTQITSTKPTPTTERPTDAVNIISLPVENSRIRSVSARPNRVEVQPSKILVRPSTATSNLPNKRHYIIRQKEEPSSNLDIIRSPQSEYEMHKDLSKSVSSNKEFLRFNFGDNLSKETPLQKRQKALFRKMIEQKRAIASGNATPLNQTKIKGGQDNSLFTILKAAISHQKGELYHSLANSLYQRPQTQQTSSSSRLYVQNTEPMFLNAKGLDSPLNINFHSNQNSTNYFGFTSHTRTNTLNESKSSLSVSLFNSTARVRVTIPENSPLQYSRGLKDLTSPVIKKDVRTLPTRTLVFNSENKSLRTERIIPKVGAALSLQLRKKLQDSLRVSKSPWKQRFVQAESTSNIPQPSGSVILEVKSVAYDRNQESMIRSSSRME